MKRFVCGATLLWLAFIPACTAPPAEGDDDPDPTPDAGVVDEPTQCHGDPCGTPSTGGCCETAECVDFGKWGDVTCANNMDIETNDCESGCVLELQDGTPICAPEDWCEVGGIWPEMYCDRADTCDVFWDDEDQCESWVESCLSTRSGSDEIDWMQAIATCTSQSECIDFQYCMYEVGFCW